MTTTEQLKLKNQTEIPIPKNGIIPEDDKVINVEKKDDIDEFISNTVDTSNDGRFSSWQAAKNLGKGLISPITSLFSSIKGFLIGAGMMIGSAVLVSATGGAILPVFLAMGIAFGAYEGAKGIYKIATAKNGDDIEKAFLDFGTATSSIGLSFLGARTSLQAAGVNTAGMSKTQAVVSCFKNLPESIKQNYTNIKELPSNIKQDFATLKMYKTKIDNYVENYRKNKEAIKPHVDEIYNEEIKLLAERLGVPEAKIREIMPKKAGYTPPIPILGGANRHFRKPSITINPTSTINEVSGHTIRDKVAQIIPHEVRHSEQRILPINQLTFREYWKTFSTGLKEQFKDAPSNNMFIPYLQSLCRYYLKAGRKIRALNIPKTQESRVQAISLLQAEAKLMRANSILLKDTISTALNTFLPIFENYKPTLRTPLLQRTTRKILDTLLRIGGTIQAKLKVYPQKSQGLSLYLNEFMEVDARTYTIARNLEMLRHDINHGQGKSNWGDRFISTIRQYIREARTLDKHSFLHSDEKWLTQQLKTIKSFFRKVRDQLKASEINPNKTARKVTIRSVSREEIEALFPGSLNLIDSLPE